MTPLPFELGGESPGKGFDKRLAAVIRRHARSGRLVSDQRPHVEDATAAPRHHSRQRQAGEGGERDDVELQHALERSRILVVDVPVEAQACVVHEDVDLDRGRGDARPQRFGRARDRQIDRLAANCHPVLRTDLPRQLLERGRIASDEHQVAAIRGELPRELAPDSPRGPCHQCGAAFEVHGQLLSRSESLRSQVPSSTIQRMLWYYGVPCQGGG